MSFNIEDHPHKRYNPLNGEWILVSPHRSKRQRQGQIEKTVVAEQSKYDPYCYLCAGNEWAGGKFNFNDKETFLFANEFSEILTGTPDGGMGECELFQAKIENGICKLINSKVLLND